MGKLKDKFTKERIKEFCRRVGGKIKTNMIYDTYACVVNVEELDWEKAHKLMQETRALLKDIPEIKNVSVFSGDLDFGFVTDPEIGEFSSFYTRPKEVEVGIQNIKGVRAFYISAKKSRELGGADITLRFLDGRIAANTAGTATLMVQKGHTMVRASMDLDAIRAYERERVITR